MIRNRQFMLGLGSGLIAGALLLQVMMIGQGQGSGLQTKKQVEQAAASLNLKVVESDQELLTEEEWRAKTEEGQAEAGQEAEQTDIPVPDTPDTPAEPQAPEALDKPGVDAVPETAAPPEPTEPKQASVEYKIAYGSTLTAVAEGLFQSGVISDKDAFLQEAKKRKINSKVRTGTFTFQVGEDYDSIIAKISPGAAD
ncbi:hypothetical protein V3851_05000 [Paenibacillus sp. M1]|uniref:YceG-like family protein n=1 Tax=Paenibacillus haidiansis TaxID=1574488 RepID=A0ABU7VN38_9BACL